MTLREFSDWWRHEFGAAFMSIHNWVETKSPDKKGTLNHWYDRLRHLTLNQLRDALEVLKSDEQLPDWQMIPLRLSIIAREQQFASRTREPEDIFGRRIQCRVCSDSGVVTVWHVETMAMARHYVLGHIELPRIKWYEAGVACECPAGEPFAKWPRRLWKLVEHKKLPETKPRFDPEQWTRKTADEEQSRRALLAWAEDYIPPATTRQREFAT